MKYVCLVLFAELFLTAPSLANRLIAVNKDGNDVSVIDLNSMKVTKTYPTGPGPHEVAVTSGGRYATVTDYGFGCGERAGRSLTVVDIETDEIKQIDLAFFRAPHGVVMLKDNKTAVVSVECSGALVLVDIEKGQVIQGIDTHAKVSHMVAAAPSVSLIWSIKNT